MVHIVDSSPLRNGGGHPAYYEDPIALTDVSVGVNLPLKARSVRALVAALSCPPAICRMAESKLRSRGSLSKRSCAARSLELPLK